MKQVRPSTCVAALAALFKPRRRRRGRGSRPARRARTPVEAVAGGERDGDARVKPGDYFICERRLYRVEHLAGERVLIEDCASGDLLDIDRGACAALKRVRPLVPN